MSSANNHPKQERWNDRYAAREWVWSIGPTGMLAERVTQLKAGRALDLACGEGRNALWLAEQGWQVTAADFAEAALEKARCSAKQRGVEVDWQLVDVGQATWPLHSFDLVCVVYLHTDPEERVRWLESAVQALKPGGLFIYIGHDPSNIEAGVGGPQDASLLLDTAELSEFLSAHEFDVIEAQVIRRPAQADSGHGNDTGIAIDTVVQARRL